MGHYAKPEEVLYHTQLSQNMLLGADIALLPGDPGRVRSLAEAMGPTIDLTSHREYTSALAQVQDRFHPGQKLGHVKGLDNIVVGPQLEPLHPVGDRRPGGDEDHRKLQRLEVFQKGEAIGAGKHDVHQGQVIVPGSRQVRGLIPIWGMVAEIAGRL